MPTANDSKLPPSPAQTNADSKTLQRENSNETSGKEGEIDRRAPVVSIRTINIDIAKSKKKNKLKKQMIGSITTAIWLKSIELFT